MTHHRHAQDYRDLQHRTHLSKSRLPSTMLAVGAAVALMAAPVIWRRLRRLDLEGRVALVNGGSRGLGAR